jgi:hypothetical protein
MTEQPQELWAVVELFGHQRIAGQVSEYNLGGTFVRVDVPAVNGRPGFTKLFGNSAIYGLTFVDRDVALAAAEKLGIAPISKWDVAAMTTEAVRHRLEHSGVDSDFDEPY